MFRTIPKIEVKYYGGKYCAATLDHNIKLVKSGPQIYAVAGHFDYIFGRHVNATKTDKRLNKFFLTCTPKLGPSRKYSPVKMRKTRFPFLSPQGRINKRTQEFCANGSLWRKEFLFFFFFQRVGVINHVTHIYVTHLHNHQFFFRRKYLKNK